MTDQEYERFKERCQALYSEWAALLGLEHWELSIEYLRDPTAMGLAQRGLSIQQPLMDCACSWEYLQAVFRVNAPACAELDDRQLEQAVIHELCHLIVDEMHEWTDDDAGARHEERVVTHLARAFQTVRVRATEEARGDQAADEDASGHAVARGSGPAIGDLAGGGQVPGPEAERAAHSACEGRDDRQR